VSQRITIRKEATSRTPQKGSRELALCRRRHKFYKIANVLAALPKSAHPDAKKALAEIWGAEDMRHAGPR